VAREVTTVDETDAPLVLRPATRSCRVKGTWTLFYGGDAYEFVDGQHYDLPHDLFEYLKTNGNIYDTMS
jgi:hypothetical protein